MRHSDDFENEICQLLETSLMRYIDHKINQQLRRNLLSLKLSVSHYFVVIIVVIINQEEVCIINQK